MNSKYIRTVFCQVNIADILQELLIGTVYTEREHTGWKFK